MTAPRTGGVTTIHGGSAKADDHTSPAFQPPAYSAMAPRWKVCRDVMGGTDVMRGDGTLDVYFPKGDAETTSERLSRVLRTEFFPLFKETVKGMVGLVFRKDPVLGDDVPSQIVDLAENIDGAGTAFPVFARRVFGDGLVTGHAGILVDVPKVSSTKPLTIAEENQLGLRPYWVHIKAEQILNWRTQTINGTVVLTLLVLAETVDVPMGAYGVVATIRYRVFKRDETTGAIKYEVWTLNSVSHEPELQADGELRNMTMIPFVAFYAGERIAPLQSIPPFIDLAYTNIAHMQVLSDHRTSLHAAGNPILVIKGRQGGTDYDPNAPKSTDPLGNPLYTTEGPAAGVGAAIITGPNVGIEVDKDGDVAYAEHSGAALGASRLEISDIENRAAAQGLSMLQRNTRQAQTAEAEKLQRTEKDASIASAARSLEDCLEIALAFTALFMALPDGGTVDIDRNFESTTIDTPRVDSLLRALVANAISRETFWDLLIAGEALPGTFDKQVEADRLDQAAAAAMAAVPGAPDPNAPPAGGPPVSGDSGGGAA